MRGGLRIEALAHEVFGDARVLRRGLVGLPGADVQVAERVGRRPVARLILDDAWYSAMAASSRPWRSSFSAFFSVSSRSMGTRVLHEPGSARV